MENLKIKLVKVLMNAVNRIEKGDSITDIKKDIANIYENIVVYDYINSSEKASESYISNKSTDAENVSILDSSDNADDIENREIVNNRSIEIDVNDRIAFIGYLFNGDKDKFDKFIMDIRSNAKSLDDAKSLIRKVISVNTEDEYQFDTLNRFVKQIEKIFN